MKIYLAARYSRRDELVQYAGQLKKMGHEVTSRWIAGNHQISDNGLSDEAHEAERTRFACEDWQDLWSAEMTISFTEPPRGSNSRGGRHVEFGAALAFGQRVIVIGHRENVFHCLPNVEFFSTGNDFLFSHSADLESFCPRCNGTTSVIIEDPDNPGTYMNGLCPECCPYPNDPVTPICAMCHGTKTVAVQHPHKFGYSLSTPCPACCPNGANAQIK